MSLPATDRPRVAWSPVVGAVLVQADRPGPVDRLTRHPDLPRVSERSTLWDRGGPAPPTRTVSVVGDRADELVDRSGGETAGELRSGGPVDNEEGAP